MAVASLTWGNLAALTQNNVKRLLAYSSISHVGYILLGLVAWDPTMQSNTAVTGIFYYLIAYGFMTIGAFAVIIVMRQRGIIGDTLDDLDGLYQRNPAAALAAPDLHAVARRHSSHRGLHGQVFYFSGPHRNASPGARGVRRLYIVPALYYYFRVVVHAWHAELPAKLPLRT